MTRKRSKSIAGPDQHLLRGRGVTATGKKASTRACHRSTRGDNRSRVTVRASVRASA